MKLKIALFLTLCAGLSYAGENINALLNACENAPNPDNGWACYEAGEYYRRNYNYEKAFKFYEKAYLLLIPHQHKAGMALASLYEWTNGLKMDMKDSDRYKKAYEIYKAACDDDYGKACAYMVRVSTDAGVKLTKAEIRKILLDGCRSMGGEESCMELAKHTDREESAYIFRLMCENDPGHCIVWRAWAEEKNNIFAAKSASEGLCKHKIASGCADAIELRAIIYERAEKEMNRVR